MNSFQTLQNAASKTKISARACTRDSQRQSAQSMSKCGSFKIQILKTPVDLLTSRRLLRKDKLGDPLFLLLKYFSPMERKRHTKFKKILPEEFYTTRKLPFLAFIKNLSARKFLK